MGPCVRRDDAGARHTVHHVVPANAQRKRGPKRRGFPYWQSGMRLLQPQNPVVIPAAAARAHEAATQPTWRDAKSLAQPSVSACPARSGRFVEPDQSDAGSPVLFAKIFPFVADPNQLYIPSVLSHRATVLEVD